jgi:hypothetical protein
MKETEGREPTDVPYNWRIEGDRRYEERRRSSERRGDLRWDPRRKERRSGKDRRRLD